MHDLNNSERKNLNWFSEQIKLHPFNAWYIFIWIPQLFSLWLIGSYKAINPSISILYMVSSLIIIWVYTSYAAYLRWRSKWWGLWLLFGLIMVSLLGFKWEKSIHWLSTVQFLSMIGILWLWWYAILNKDIITGAIAIAILWFVIWYTKTYK